MIKLTANMCKKVPIAGMNYSSQSFMAGLEVEISEHSNNADICERIREVYKLLEKSVDEQIKDSQPQRTRRDPQQQQSRRASRAQLKAIYAITRANQIPEHEVDEMLRKYGARKSEDLTMQQASELIGQLKEEYGREGVR